MGRIEDSIRAKLQSHFAPEYLELENESHGHRVPANSETHFRLVLVSAQFEGQSRVDRQRTVMSLFDEERGLGLHALTLRTFTPTEWAAVRDQFQMESPACHGGSKTRQG